MRGHKHHIALVRVPAQKGDKEGRPGDRILRTGHPLGEGVLHQQLKMKGCPGKFTVGKGSHRAKDPRLRGSREPRVARIK